MSRAAKEYLKEPYARILIPTEEGGYTTEILEFPGCFSEGETAEEAISNLETAASNWIQAAQHQKLPIPPASDSRGYSGRIALRIPRSLHRKAAMLAERDAVSLNQFIVAAIAAKVGIGEFSTSLINLIRYDFSELLAQLKEMTSTMREEIAGNLHIILSGVSGISSAALVCDWRGGEGGIFFARIENKLEGTYSCTWVTMPRSRESGHSLIQQEESKNEELALTIIGG